MVPVIRRLVRKGLPVSCALTYMLAAPIVNPITALSTWKAFADQGISINGHMFSAQLVMTSGRLGLGFLVAVLIGWVVSRLPMSRVLKRSLVDDIGNAHPEVHDHDHSSHQHGEGCCGHDHHHDHHAPAPARSGDQRLIAAFRSSLKDFVDVGVYFSIGIAITALFNTGIAPGAAWLDSLANRHILAPCALMVLAFVLSLCSTSDAFIAATLDKFTHGAKLAFLVFGPMLDLKLLFLYQTVLNKKFLIAMAVALFLVIAAATIGFQWYIELPGPP